jgi:hypothetical protein
MSKKQNRIRARRARQAQELLSLRAELILLYDGAPMPDHYLEVDRLTTRALVRNKRWYDNMTQPTPIRTTQYVSPSYQAQIDAAAEQLRQQLDQSIVDEVLGLTRSK